MTSETNRKPIIDRAKALIADPLKRIELDDLINECLRSALAVLSPVNFPANASVDTDSFNTRISQYEMALDQLQSLVILLARWGDEETLRSLEKIFCLLAEEKGQNGVNVWLRLEWYPLLFLMYSAGISGLSARRYDALSVILTTRVQTNQSIYSGNERPLVIPTLAANSEVSDRFGGLSGNPKHTVPLSEYLFSRLRHVLDEVLLLRGRYEGLFDRMELFLALTYADLRNASGEEHFWGPPGRFLWKHKHSESPLIGLIAEAKEQGAGWDPLTHGFFGGSIDRFLKVAGGYKELLDRHPRW
jgi:hypothetical protein